MSEGVLDALIDALGMHISVLGECRELRWWEYRILKKTFPGEKIYRLPTMEGPGLSWMMVASTLRSGLITSIGCQSETPHELLAEGGYQFWVLECQRLGTPEISKTTDALLWDTEFGNVSLGRRSALRRFYINLVISASLSVPKKSGVTEPPDAPVAVQPPSPPSDDDEPFVSDVDAINAELASLPPVPSYELADAFKLGPATEDPRSALLDEIVSLRAEADKAADEEFDFSKARHLDNIRFEKERDLERLDWRVLSPPVSDYHCEGYYFSHCPDCSHPMRVPSDKGSIRIKCPHCSCQFVRET